MVKHDCHFYRQLAWSSTDHFLIYFSRTSVFKGNRLESHPSNLHLAHATSRRNHVSNVARLSSAGALYRNDVASLGDARKTAYYATRARHI